MLLLSYVMFIATFIVQSYSEVIEAMDSDYLSLFVENSSNPNIPGDGVYARYDIQPNSIICEYRGAVVPRGTLLGSDKLMGVTGPTGQEMTIVGLDPPTICSLLNDCAMIFNTSYSEKELEDFYMNDSIPTYPGTSYGAVAKHMNSKIFYVSIRHISAGEEIFVPYGRYARVILCQYEFILSFLLAITGYLA